MIFFPSTTIHLPPPSPPSHIARFALFSPQSHQSFLPQIPPQVWGRWCMGPRYSRDLVQMVGKDIHMLDPGTALENNCYNCGIAHTSDSAQWGTQKGQGAWNLLSKGTDTTKVKIDLLSCIIRTLSNPRRCQPTHNNPPRMNTHRSGVDYRIHTCTRRVRG